MEKSKQMGKNKRKKAADPARLTTQSATQSVTQSTTQYVAPKIALTMMVKDEEEGILVSLRSVVRYVSDIIIYDTGSTDNTLAVIREFCMDKEIPVHIKEGAFVDFSTSRNVCLDFADEVSRERGIHYLLLFDSRDELRNGDRLVKACSEFLDSPSSGFLVTQEWWSGQHDKYYNVRLVKPNCGWRYRGSVHEWIGIPGEDRPVIRLDNSFVIYQDRTKDNGKSHKRFSRDKELLLRDHLATPDEPRTLFYLAQTCECLTHNEEAYTYYEMRSKLNGFQEEVFHSYLRLGNLSLLTNKGWEVALGWYHRAFGHTMRCEPLIKIAEYYRSKDKWAISHSYLRLACSLEYPNDCILFVDKRAYDYIRWHLLGIVSFYCGQYADGILGCNIAISAEDREIDRKNLQFYTESKYQVPSSSIPYVTYNSRGHTINYPEKGIVKNRHRGKLGKR